MILPRAAHERIGHMHVKNPRRMCAQTGQEIRPLHPSLPPTSCSPPEGALERANSLLTVLTKCQSSTLACGSHVGMMFKRGKSCCVVCWGRGNGGSRVNSLLRTPQNIQIAHHVAHCLTKMRQCNLLPYARMGSNTQQRSTAKEGGALCTDMLAGTPYTLRRRKERMPVQLQLQCSGCWPCLACSRAATCSRPGRCQFTASIGKDPSPSPYLF